jgi:hypothetical protein
VCSRDESVYYYCSNNTIDLDLLTAASRPFEQIGWLAACDGMDRMRLHV